MEQDEQWSTGKRYFDMAVYWQWHADNASGPCGESQSESLVASLVAPPLERHPESQSETSQREIW